MDDMPPAIPRILFDCPHCRTQLVINVPGQTDEGGNAVFGRQHEVVCTRCSGPIYVLYGFYYEAMTENQAKKDSRLYRLMESTRKLAEPADGQNEGQS